MEKCPFKIALDPTASPTYAFPKPIITSYNDVHHILMHSREFSSDIPELFMQENSPVFAEVIKRYQAGGFLPAKTLVTNDGESHADFRLLTENAFQEIDLEVYKRWVASEAKALLDIGDNDTLIEVVSALSQPLAIRANAHALGLPEKDWQLHRDWAANTVERIDPNVKPSRELEITDELIRMQNYLHQHCQLLKSRPKKSILSYLSNAQIAGRPLTDDELVNISTTLLVGGTETTASALATAIYLLASTPGLLQTLKENTRFTATFVEEVLRLFPPIPQLYRKSRFDVTLGNQIIRQNSTEIISFAHANRDRSKYEEADAIDLNRPHPMKHFSFGRGKHYCVGQGLARAAINTVLQEIIGSCAAIDCVDTPKWKLSYQTSSLAALTVKLIR